MPTDGVHPPGVDLGAVHPDLLGWRGRIVGRRYRLQDILGAGGVGVVYRAHDLERDRPAAVKILGDGAVTSHQTMGRFEREGQTLSRLAHPHIVEVLGYGVSDGVPYLAMELLEGETLAQRLEDAEPLPLGLAFEIARQVLEGLAYAHRMGVVHRDLKPANVFMQLAPDGVVHIKLLDFGLAKLLTPDTTEMASTLTQSGMVMGTPLYMAPEQATGGRVDFTVDVYAAGALLFEMLTGHPPFLAETHLQLIKAHLLQPVPLVSEARRDLPNARGLDALIVRAMAKEPRARFADGQTMLEALLALRLEPADRRGHRARARKRWLWSLWVLLPLAGAYAGLDLHRRARPAITAADRSGLPAPRDLWQELGVPDALATFHAQVQAGEGIERDQIPPIQEYARQNRGDARPYLLLARGFANRHWRKDAVLRYLRAFRTDPSARGDPHMLQDLLEIAAHDTFGEQACDAIAEIYGPEALPFVQREAGRALPGTPHADRLRQLADGLVAR